MTGPKTGGTSPSPDPRALLSDPSTVSTTSFRPVKLSPRYLFSMAVLTIE